MSYKTETASGVIKDSFRELMKGVFTSIPGYVLTLESGGSQQRAQIQVGIQRVDINGATFNMPPIINVPVLFLGGNYSVEYQIDAGTEGLIFFSQRCVDGWKNTGGIAANPLGRFHDMQDAFFIPGFRSLPNVLQSFQNNGIRLRNKSGSQFAWLKNDGSIAVENGSGFIRIGSDGTVNINGVTFDTSSNVTTATTVKAAKVTGTEDVVFGTISGKKHVHGNVERGNDVSGDPQ